MSRCQVSGSYQLQLFGLLSMGVPNPVKGLGALAGGLARGAAFLASWGTNLAFSVAGNRIDAEFAEGTLSCPCNCTNPDGPCGLCSFATTSSDLVTYTELCWVLRRERLRV